MLTIIHNREKENVCLVQIVCISVFLKFHSMCVPKNSKVELNEDLSAPKGGGQYEMEFIGISKFFIKITKKCTEPRIPYQCCLKSHTSGKRGHKLLHKTCYTFKAEVSFLLWKTGQECWENTTSMAQKHRGYLTLRLEQDKTVPVSHQHSKQYEFTTQKRQRT